MWPDAFVRDSISYLSKWGYERVENPSPGDLVLYSYRGEARHWGIWTHDNNVLSKLGISFVVKHPLGDVVLGYGDDVYFFNKKIKSIFLNNFINELEKAYQLISNFSHPPVVSPLSTRGCVKK